MTREHSQKIKISACIILYNEEVHILDLLNNIINFVDEMIFVYDGEECQDKTLEIINNFFKDKKNFPHLVFKREHTGNPESHRPFSFKKATGDWLLYIDADERLNGNWDEVRKYIISHPEISKIRFLFGTNKELSDKKFSRRKTSLFKKNDSYFIGILGQKADIIRGESYNYPSNMASILHLDTRQSFGDLVKKAKRYAFHRAEGHLRKMEDIDFFNIPDDKKKDFAKIKKIKIKFAPLLLFIAPFKGSIYCLITTRSLKKSIISFYQLLLFYLHILKYKMNYFFKISKKI